MRVAQKIAALRKSMTIEGLDAYIIPSSDPHLSEYLPAHWQSRAWLSGFTGSAGTLVVTQEHAGLWTDSRYFLQAERQLKGSGIALHKLTIAHTAEHLEWLKNNMQEGSKLGFDGKVFSAAQVRQMARMLESKHIILQGDPDLFEKIWTNRPPLPSNPIFEVPAKIAGRTRLEKLRQVRDILLERKASWHFISALDEIAWLFNLRGSDVECNPVFVAFAVVGLDRAYLFAQEHKFSNELKNELKSDAIVLKPYDGIDQFLQNIPSRQPILIDRATISNHLFSAIKEDLRLEGDNIIDKLKTIKNETEQAHLRNAMVKDGVVLVKLFRWLEDVLKERAVPETEVAEKLIELRRQQALYQGESFEAIVGYQSNGAIVHYRPEHKTCAKIRRKGLLLLDCGGQYTDGTTDITRTIALSRPNTRQKIDFTLVLKGHLAIAMAKFPTGTHGVQLDTMARIYLWRHLRNYGHGTGHGVGFFLNVHEGPQGMSPIISNRSKTPFEPGMLTSNEPGLYRTGEYGIRIENLVLCREDSSNEFGNFLGFETLSLCPIDQTLIDVRMLDRDEKQWLNEYHQTVQQRLSPHLDQAEKNWLIEKCKPLK